MKDIHLSNGNRRNSQVTLEMMLEIMEISQVAPFKVLGEANCSLILLPLVYGTEAHLMTSLCHVTCTNVHYDLSSLAFNLIFSLLIL